VALFNETAGVFVVEVDEPETALEAFGDVPCVILGHTSAVRELTVHQAGAPLFSAPLAELQAAWERPMRAVFH
jgi:hypothetical protein